MGTAVTKICQVEVARTGLQEKEIKALGLEHVSAVIKSRTKEVMDVFEHAYLLDYGLKRADYIEEFFKNIDWTAVEARLR